MKTVNSHELGKNWGWILTLGVLILITGLFAASHTLASSLISISVIGYCLLFGGIFHTFGAFYARGWSGFFVELLFGVFTAFVGFAIASNPVAAGASLTLIIGIFLMVEGVMRSIAALIERPIGWVLSLISGVVSAVLGWMVYQQWPYSSLWLLGIFLAVRLILAGTATMALGLALKRLRAIEA